MHGHKESNKDLNLKILTSEWDTANILVFYFSAIRRDIDLKCMQDIYGVALNSQFTFIGQWSRSQRRYIAF